MLVDAHPDAIAADLERRKEGRSLIEEGKELSRYFFPFVRAAWHVLRPEEPFVNNWHLGAIAEKLQAITDNEIDRLFIWVPPGSMKTLEADVMWPVWEWTRNPGLRFLTCMYDQDMQIEQGMIPSRDLLQSAWFMDRWPHVVLKETRRAAYTNTRGGARWAAAPNAKKVTGRHAHRIILDDPNDATSAEGDSESELEKVSTWHDAALGTRLMKGGAKIVIQQRLHEADLSGHLLERDGERWEKLCLPEEYDPKHPFVWPDDPRESAGELLWPELFDRARHDERVATMGARRASGQLQQEPAAREGEIFKRANWRYFPPKYLDLLEAMRIEAIPAEHPFRRFPMILYSWDTAFEEKTSSDPVAGSLIGVIGADRFILKVRNERMSLPATKTAMLEFRAWGMARFPYARHYILIENKSNGPKIIADLRREIPGVMVYNPGNLDKTRRAIQCEPDFDSHNVWLPGTASVDGTEYDPAFTPAWAQEVVEQCAKFPKGRHDDIVDTVTQALNWVRPRSTKPAEIFEVADMVMPTPYGIPTGAGSILGA